MSVTGVVLSSSLIAFPFARLQFRGKNLLFTLVLATMLLPAPVLLVPQFLIFYEIGWYGTYYPLWVPSFAGEAFFIFLIRQYMRSIPIELDEAARVDGAGYWTIYWRIIMPLCIPVLTVTAVFTVSEDVERLPWPARSTSTTRISSRSRWHWRRWCRGSARSGTR